MNDCNRSAEETVVNWELVFSVNERVIRTLVEAEGNRLYILQRSQNFLNEEGGK